MLFSTLIRAASNVLHRRRDPREFNGGEVVIATQDGRVLSAHLRDRSRCGFRLTGRAPIPQGQRVRVIMPACAFTTQVVWSDTTDCGLLILSEEQIS